ncbi:unnamed protein product [Amoebophrya sp. A25]|nr:unnamed protein product [Amoebophrya sp. A25]|eukprot:GSA25T00021283001.1
MAQVNPQFAQIGEQFVQHFYNTFDTNRMGLTQLYTNDSMLTFEGEAFQGQQKIMEKLNNLKFSKIAHKLTKVDCQPNPFNNGVMIFVTGDLKVDEDDNVLKFAEVFHLVPHGGSFIIINDMFRLNIG